MIPTFLRGIETDVRKLVAAGLAVHVTLKTAAVLARLAELPWASSGIATADPLPSIRVRELVPVAMEMGLPWSFKDTGRMVDYRASVVRHVSPADIALGWLRASLATPSADDDGDFYVHEDAIKRAAECAELAVLAAERLALLHAENVVCRQGTGDRDRGTIDGARSAWAFIIRSMTPTLAARTSWSQEIQDWTVARDALLAAYRRELEAMK